MEAAKTLYTLFTEKTADAKRNIMENFKPYIRADFLKKVNFNSMFFPLLRWIHGASINKDAVIITEDFADRMIESKMPLTLRDMIEDSLKYKFGFSDEEAEKVTDPRALLTPELKEKLNSVLPKIQPIVYAYLMSTFRNWTHEYIRKHNKEESVEELKDKGKEVAVEVEDLIEDLDKAKTKEKNQFSVGLIKDVVDLINREYPSEKQRNTVKKILKDRIIDENKTQGQIAKEMDTNLTDVQRKEVALKNRLKEFLSAQMGKKTESPRGPEDQKSKVQVDPNVVLKYQKVLSDPENSKNFKDFMALKFTGLGELKKDILNLLAEGQAPKDISNTLGTNIENVYKAKNVHFNKDYKDWYTEKMDTIKQACSRIRTAAQNLLIIKSAQDFDIVLPSKFQKKLEPKKEVKEDEIKETSLEKYVKNQLGGVREPIHVVVTVSANYDGHDSKDPEKDPIDFKYIGYTASMDLEHSVFKKKNNIEYDYAQALNPDGSFAGKPQSTLKINSENEDDSSLKDYIDKHMTNKVAKEGLLPSGEYSKASFEYLNKKTGKTYPSPQAFYDSFKGLLDISDPVHIKRREEFEQKQQRKSLRQWGMRPDEDKTVRLEKEIKNLLKIEDSKGREKDPETIKELKKDLEELKKFKEEKDIPVSISLDDLQKGVKRLGDRMRQRMLEQTAEKTAAIELPSVDSDKVTELQKILTRYGVNKPTAAQWKTPHDMRVLALGIKEGIRRMMESGAENLKGDAKEELINKYNDEYQKASDLLVEHIETLRKMRDILKTESPEEYNKFFKDRDPFWVDDPKSVIDAVKKELAPASVAGGKSAFPGAQNEDVKKLKKILQEYEVDSPKLDMWLDMGSMREIASALRANAETKVLKDLDGIKGKKEEKQSAMESLKKKFKEDLINANTYIKSIPKDVKARLQLMKEKDPEGAKRFLRNKDESWVEDTDRLGNEFKNITETLFKGTRPESAPKQTGIQMIEKEKYESLEAMLNQVKNGLVRVANALKNSSLEPLSAGSNQASIQQQMQQIKDDSSQIAAQLSEMKKTMASSKDPETKEKIEDLEKALFTAGANMADLIASSKKTSDIPALGMAKILKGYVQYVGDLYNKLSSFIWFKEKRILTAEEEELDVDYSLLQNIRNKIVSKSEMISGTPVAASDKIKKLILDLKTLIKKFISVYEDAPVIKETLPTPQPALEKSAALDEDQEKERNKKIMQYIFSGDKLKNAKDLIGRLEGRKETKSIADSARKELDDLTSKFVDIYKEGLPNSDLKEIMQKYNVSKDKALDYSKRHTDTMATAAIEAFLGKWEMVLNPPPKEKKIRERSPLGNKPADAYTELVDLVTDELGGVLKEPPKEEETVAKAIPNKQSLEKYLKDTILDEEDTRKAIAKYVDYFSRWSGEMERGRRNIPESGQGDTPHGGGGGKSKGRSKPVRPNPPEGTWQALKNEVLRMFKTQSAQDIVHYIMQAHLDRIKNQAAQLKEGEYLSTDSVVDSLVSLLKNLYQNIQRLRIQPSETVFMKPSVVHTTEAADKTISDPHTTYKQRSMPSGPSTVSGKPDISIDSVKEAMDVYEKIIKIYKVINFYIAPDKVGVPPEDIRRLQKPTARFLPFNLLGHIEDLKKKEQIKTAYNTNHRDFDLRILYGSRMQKTIMAMVSDEVFGDKE